MATDEQTVANTGRGANLAELVLVRHGESMGNVADREAQAAGLTHLANVARDPDVELSPDGIKQATALGKRLGSLPPERYPSMVISSPYRRAEHTAELATASHPLTVTLDERLRERELGVFDGLTWQGILEELPQEAARRERMGKFYYRPPGGESWCDVMLRVRSILNEAQSRYPGERLWIFTHEAVVLCFRAALEGIGERDILDVQREQPLANCGVTTYVADDSGVLRLQSYGETTPVEEAGAPVTQESDAATKVEH